MKKVKLLMMIAVMVIVSSCKKNDAASVSYQGQWVGSYTGAKDNGTLNVTVNAAGTITGTAISKVYNQTDQLSGSIDNSGNYNGTTVGGASFKGQFSASSASGTWQNTSVGFSGNWTATKQ